MNLDVAFWTALFLSTLRQTTPLLFTALGGNVLGEERGW
jgi:ABC-type uncharacterized transport system permease subunit